MSSLVFAAAFGIIVIACTVQSSIGFGANLLAMPTIVHFAPELVPGAVLVAVTAMNLLMLVRDRAGLEVRPVGRALIGRAIGTVVAVAVLGALSEDRLELVIGLAALAMVVVAASGVSPERTDATMLVAGTVSGFTGAVAGIGGPPVALLFQRSSGQNIRGSMAGFLIGGTVLTLIGLGLAGEIGARDFGWGLALVPAAVIGYFLSGPLLPIVDRGWTRPAIITLSAAASIVLLARAIFG